MNGPRPVKADLIPYSAEYSRTVLSWLDSPQTLYRVCRGKEFPPTEELVNEWQRRGGSSYLLSGGGRPVAYGELWNRPIELAVEIAHVVVDPARRSQGYGTKLIHLLYERAADRPGVAKVVVNLYDSDEEVLGCFLKAGFEFAPAAGASKTLRMVRPAQPDRRGP